MTELERRVTVEEAWGQRTVMEAVANEHRLDKFNSRKAAFLCVGGEVTSRAAPCVAKSKDRTIERLQWRGKPGNNPGARF
jgi:hypothetical protein